MSHIIRVTLEPLGETLEVQARTSLRGALFQRGVEFPCGGHGHCGGCRVRLLEGHLPRTPADEMTFSPNELDDGWRLSCCARPTEDITLEIAQWEESILADDAAFAFVPAPGLGVAVDIGTTTLVAQLVDRSTGNVLAVESTLNPQAGHGSDLMSRVEVGLTADGLALLREMIRKRIGEMINRMLVEAKADPADVVRIVAVGNTVMHHLFCGLDVTPLSCMPFRSGQLGRWITTAAELDWPCGGRVHVLPCIGGFIGSDVLAGIVATGLPGRSGLTALVDLGTNGEIVLARDGRLWCASAAAGPAFEGARIEMGMRAATGAISEVLLERGELACGVIGGDRPRGICGSGLVDAVAAALVLGQIAPSGRLADGLDRIPLLEPVYLSQKDIRELQLAKGAIAAGLRMLLRLAAAEGGTLSSLMLAGAFGNYIDRESARRIGLLDVPSEVIHPIGNSALKGAKMALFMDESDLDFTSLRSATMHVSLADDPTFQEMFADAMGFPPPDDAVS